MAYQNELDMIKDRLSRGEITVDQANVDMVLMERVRLIAGRVPAPIRSALLAAVRAGVLGRMPKSPGCGEIFYHPNFANLARDIQRKEKEKTIKAILSVCA